VFGVSVKDRGAVSMAGHAGKAFWFSKVTGQFVTSDYYYDRYPEWVVQWNAKKHPQRYAGTQWKLTGKAPEYLFGDADDRSWETDFPGWGRTFPHAYGPGDGKYYTTFLTLSPAGDELTLDFAKALVENEAIGQDAVTDCLAISFSSTDYINHLFGPSSLEAEENQRRLDRTLAELLRFIDAKIGLSHTLIVLSGDHGSPEVPGYLEALGIGAGYIEPEAFDRQPALDALKKQFGLGDELIETYFHPYLYLNRELIRKKGLDQGAVERAVAAELVRFPGVSLAVSSHALRSSWVGLMALAESKFSPCRLKKPQRTERHRIEGWILTGDQVGDEFGCCRGGRHSDHTVAGGQIEVGISRRDTDDGQIVAAHGAHPRPLLQHGLPWWLAQIGCRSGFKIIDAHRIKIAIETGKLHRSAQPQPILPGGSHD
jgi:hypothetical protein